LKPVKQENQAYLKEQILTYLGNKRSLLGFIERGVKYAKDELKKEKHKILLLFFIYKSTPAFYLIPTYIVHKPARINSPPIIVRPILLFSLTSSSFHSLI